jgi:hypothetical protein
MHVTENIDLIKIWNFLFDTCSYSVYLMEYNKQFMTMQ